MDNSIAWIFIFPLFGSVVCALAGFINRKIAYPISVLSMVGACWAGIQTLLQAIKSPKHEVSYLLGGWTLDLFPRGVGIEFRADLLAALIALVVLGVGLIVTVYSKIPVEKETPNKETIYYSLMLLQITGLAGICLTGDAFNLYVLIEDDGPGFPEDIIKALGEPYIKSRSKLSKDNGGLGLGTFLGKTLLERQSAIISFENGSSLNGAIVKIKWRINDISI